MHRGTRRKDDPDESVTGRMTRLDDALADVRRQSAKIVAETERKAETGMQARRRQKAADAAERRRSKGRN